jgi:hypothetical protein
MAVIEYMMVKDGPRRQVPEFVGDRGHWYSPIDSTYIGWVDDSRDYYVPDTVLTLTKAQLVARQLLVHAEYPMRKPETVEHMQNNTKPDVMTEAEVTAQVEEWYDAFVTSNTTNG